MKKAPKKPPKNPPKSPEQLSPKRQRFVQEYLLAPNATAAYKRAGYKVTNDATAQAAASRLLKNPKVAEAIRAGQEARTQRTEITADWVVKEACKIHNAAFEEGKYAAAGSMLALLAKHTGGFSERHEHTGAKGGPIQIRQISFVEFARTQRAGEPAPPA
jgi:phage terminase small subunit